MREVPVASAPMNALSSALLFRCGAAVLVAGLIAAALRANPTGPAVVAGRAEISADGATLTVRQGTDRAIINWADFNVARGETTRFVQPDALSAVLNRVTGGNPTAIHGTLQANGRVFVLNPNGVLVGPEGRVDTAGFLASTHRLADADFLRGGALNFSSGGSGGIVNLGTISASGGDVVLLARTVENRGAITAPQGAVRLGAGDEILLAPAGDHRLVINTGSHLAERGIDDTGTINAAAAELQAAGGNAYALAVNHGGAITATGVEQRDGRILLTAAGGAVAISGALTATRADGSGGEILVGGDYQGGTAAVANAARVTVAEGAVLRADAHAARADGGRVIVWADDATRFQGKIFARAGTGGGDGGFVEVSGKQWLDYRGTADLRAPAGRAGTLLLDPTDLVISNAADDPSLQIEGDGFGGRTIGASGAAVSYLSVTTLQNQLALGNVLVNTASGQSGLGDITVSDAVVWNEANTLTLRADRDIAINASITGAAGALVLAGRHVTSAAAAAIETGTLTVATRVDGGATNFQGAITADTLNLSVGELYVPTLGTFSATNAANRIGTVMFNQAGSTGGVQGDIAIADGSGGLTVDGSAGTHTGNLTLRTVGDLTLAPNAGLNATGVVVLEAAEGNFINEAGAGVLPNATRFIVYANDPAATQRGGLTGTKRYDATFTSRAPGTVTTAGGHFFYRIAPTLTFTADNQRKTYGEANPVFTFTGPTGFIDGDTAETAFAGAPVFTSAGVDAGTHAITGALGTLVSELGYRFAFAEGMLTIDPATLTLQVIVNNATRTYGAPNPVFTAAIAGFAPGDDASVVSGLTFSTPATLASPVGSYAVTASGATAPNYVFTYTAGTLTITPAPLTITASDATRLYGAANPSFHATFTGLVNGDRASVVSGLTFATTATPGSGVGTYAITPVGGQATNYSIVARLPGTLTIAPAPLTITANNAERQVLRSNPTFNATFTGLVNGDTSAVVTGLGFTTPATRASPAGDYAITPVGGQAANYAITRVPGVLTVRPRPPNPAVNQDVVEEGLGTGQRPDTVLASGARPGAGATLTINLQDGSSSSGNEGSQPTNTNHFNITIIENEPTAPEKPGVNRNGYTQWWDVASIEDQLRSQQYLLEQRGIYGPHDQFIDLLKGGSLSPIARSTLRQSGYSDADIALIDRYLHKESVINMIAADRVLTSAERNAIDRMLRDARIRDQVVNHSQGPYGLVPAAAPVMDEIIASISREDIKDILFRKAYLEYLNTPEGLLARTSGGPTVLPLHLIPTAADIDLYYNGLGKDSITDGIIMPFLMERVLSVRQRDAMMGIALSTGAAVNVAPVSAAERALYNQVEAFIQMQLEQAAEAMLVSYLNEFTSEALRVDQHETERSQRSHGLHNLIDVNAEGQMRYGEYTTDTAGLLQSAFGSSGENTLATDPLAIAAGMSGVVTAAGTAGMTGSTTALQAIMPFFKGISSARVLGGPIAAILGTALAIIFETAAELDWSGDPREAIVRCLQEVRSNPVSLSEIIRADGGEAIVWSALADMVGGAGDEGYQSAHLIPYVEVPSGP